MLTLAELGRRALDRLTGLFAGEPAPPAVTSVGPESSVLQEVRLGLVMNGGVSLAVWIGGVTQEIDSVRRAADATESELREPTTAKYHKLLAVLRERVVVDVIAGASAGGINGALLGAAVYAERPLPPLRDVWITVGDFSKLLRSPSQSQPPSLLRGDDFVLRQLEQRFDELLARGGNGSIYLYVTGTDFYGFSRRFADSTFRRFRELDHRRVFVFQHPPPDGGGETEAEALELERRVDPPSSDQPSKRNEVNGDVMPQVVRFKDAGAARLLAQAARSSSSFPVAFEAHGMKIEGNEGEELQRWLIDGGVLDNQPFNPVLNRIATISAGDVPLRRVLGYTVPYVTEVGTGPPASGPGTAPDQPTARQTASAASSLPRDVPKLVDLERVTRELIEGRRSDRARARLEAIPASDLAALAETLFQTYCDTRWYDCLETFAQWARPSFRPGAGEIGQLETLDPEQALAEDSRPSREPRRTGFRWIPDQRRWDDADSWRWGLSPSERIARAALARLRALLHERPDDEEVAVAKGAASDLVSNMRSLKFLTAERFQAVAGESLAERADKAYAEAVDEMSKGFRDLSDRLERLQDRTPRPPRLQQLIDAEVVENAFIVSRVAPPAVFDFLHMSAGIRNALGHPDRTPETKLAGMKLNHFAGFLKRSWRANDWMWGRLDAVQYLVAAVLDLLHLRRLTRTDDLALAQFAFVPDTDSTLAGAWKDTIGWARRRPYIDAEVGRTVCSVLDELKPKGTAEEQFVHLLSRARDFSEGPPERPRVANALLDCCRAAIAAPIQLEVLRCELGRVRDAVEDDLAAGASRGSSGADWARSRFDDTPAGLVAQFHRLRIGNDESPEQEGSSKLGMDVASTAAAVASAAFSGRGGGLPAPLRAPLASLRALTLVFNIIVRLLVRTPPFGVAAVIAAAVAVVWALTQPNTLLTAALPGLAAAAIGGVAVLITMVTSPLEARCRSFGQGIGLVVLVLAPAALLFFVLGLPFALQRHLSLSEVSLGGASPWLADRTTRTAVDVAGSVVLAAQVVGVARLLLGLISRRLRVILLWGYRWSLLLAGGAIAGGAVYENVQGDKRNWNGTILFLILFGAISLAPLFAEIAAGAWWLLKRIAAAAWLFLKRVYAKVLGSRKSRPESALEPKDPRSETA